MNATRTRSSSSRKNASDDQDRKQPKTGGRGAQGRRAAKGGAAKSRTSAGKRGASKGAAAKKTGAKRAGAKKTAAKRSSARRATAAKSRSRSPIGQAIDMLTDQHKEVQRMFRQGERMKDDPERLREVVQACCDALTMHADIEEQYFYPVMRENMRDPEPIDEARIEHESAKQLIAQLQDGDPRDEQYAARFKVLGEYVKHHIKEEEKQIFPRAKRVRADWEPLVQALQASEQEQGMEGAAMHEGQQRGGREAMQGGESAARGGREAASGREQPRRGRESEAQRRGRGGTEGAGSEGLVGGSLLGGTQEGEEALRSESGGRGRSGTRGRQGRGRSAGTATGTGTGEESLDTGVEEGNLRGREEGEEQQTSRGARSGSR